MLFATPRMAPGPSRRLTWVPGHTHPGLPVCGPRPQPHSLRPQVHPWRMGASPEPDRRVSPDVPDPSSSYGRGNDTQRGRYANADERPSAGAGPGWHGGTMGRGHRRRRGAGGVRDVWRGRRRAGQIRQLVTRSYGPPVKVCAYATSNLLRRRSLPCSVSGHRGSRCRPRGGHRAHHRERPDFGALHCGQLPNAEYECLLIR